MDFCLFFRKTAWRPTGVRRRHGVSSATSYEWKAKFGGIDVSDAGKPKTLESENVLLKKLLPDSLLGESILKAQLGKHWLCPMQGE